MPVKRAPRRMAGSVATVACSGLRRCQSSVARTPYVHPVGSPAQQPGAHWHPTLLGHATHLCASWLPSNHLSLPPCSIPGWRWTINFWRLVLFAVLLLPGFAQMIAFYFLSPRLLRSVPYGLKVRQHASLLPLSSFLHPAEQSLCRCVFGEADVSSRCWPERQQCCVATVPSPLWMDAASAPRHSCCRHTLSLCIHLCSRATGWTSFCPARSGGGAAPAPPSSLSPAEPGPSATRVRPLREERCALSTARHFQPFPLLQQGRAQVPACPAWAWGRG
jgi:hypothetical protein